MPKTVRLHEAVCAAMPGPFTACAREAQREYTPAAVSTCCTCQDSPSEHNCSSAHAMWFSRTDGVCGSSSVAPVAWKPSRS